MNLFVSGKKASTPAEPKVPGADGWPERWPQTVQEFESLVDACSHRLAVFAARRLGNVHDAEDVVQDVFVHAFNARAERKEVRNVGAYLYSMTANACTDLLRERQRRGTPLPFDAAPQVPEAGEPTPNPVVLAEETARAEQLLRRLPRVQADAVRLRVFGELTLNEVAEAMGRSTNTANSRLRYAFKKLRRIVTRECR